MNRYILVNFSNGYCGCNDTEVLIFNEGTPDSKIDMYCSELLPDYAENYYDEDDGDYEEYLENVSFDWFDITGSEEINDWEWFKV